MVDERWERGGGRDTEDKGKVTAGVWRERGWWMRGGKSDIEDRGNVTAGVWG